MSSIDCAMDHKKRPDHNHPTPFRVATRAPLRQPSGTGLGWFLPTQRLTWSVITTNRDRSQSDLLPWFDPTEMQTGIDLPRMSRRQ